MHTVESFVVESRSTEKKNAVTQLPRRNLNWDDKLVKIRGSRMTANLEVTTIAEDKLTECMTGSMIY